MPRPLYAPQEGQRSEYLSSLSPIAHCSLEMSIKPRYSSSCSSSGAPVATAADYSDLGVEVV